jgi:hypothetical protein
MPDLIRHPATARLRRERVFRDQVLDHAGPRTQFGVTGFERVCPKNFATKKSPESFTLSGLSFFSS